MTTEQTDIGVTVAILLVASALIASILSASGALL
jgi:hypothetical protein